MSSVGAGSCGPSRQTLCVCAVSAASLGVSLWLLWPRKSEARRNSARQGLRRLHEEFAAAYGDVSCVVSGCWCRTQETSSADGAAGIAAAAAASNAAAFAAAGATGGADVPGDDGMGSAGVPEAPTEAEKLKQVLEQPLVLGAALHEAASRAADVVFSTPGSAPDGLESELQRQLGEDVVRNTTAEIRAMHEACLKGHALPAFPIQVAVALGSKNNLDGVSSVTPSASEPWGDEEALEMLEALARAKVERLRAIFATGVSPIEGEEVEARRRRLATSAILASVEAENEIWDRKWPGNRARRCGLVPALARLPQVDGLRARREKVESDLEALASQLQG